MANLRNGQLVVLTTSLTESSSAPADLGSSPACPKLSKPSRLTSRQLVALALHLLELPKRVLQAEAYKYFGVCSWILSDGLKT
eukprot:5083055-Amphidinium_carterae.1